MDDNAAVLALLIDRQREIEQLRADLRRVGEENRQLSESLNETRATQD